MGDLGVVEVAVPVVKGRMSRGGEDVGRDFAELKQSVDAALQSLGEARALIPSQWDAAVPTDVLSAIDGGITVLSSVQIHTFITDIKNLPSLREVRSRRLSKTQPPANTLLQVSSLARPELLIEIEATAVLSRIVRQ